MDGAGVQQLPSKLHPLLTLSHLAVGNQPVHKLIPDKALFVSCEVVFAVSEKPSYVFQPAQDEGWAN